MCELRGPRQHGWPTPPQAPQLPLVHTPVLAMTPQKVFAATHMSAPACASNTQHPPVQVFAAQHRCPGDPQARQSGPLPVQIRLAALHV